MIYLPMPPSAAIRFRAIDFLIFLSRVTDYFSPAAFTFFAAIDIAFFDTFLLSLLIFYLLIISLRHTPPPRHTKLPPLRDISFFFFFFHVAAIFKMADFRHAIRHAATP